MTDDLEPLATALWQIEGIKVAVGLLGMAIVGGLYLCGILVPAVFDNTLLVALLSWAVFCCTSLWNLYQYVRLKWYWDKLYLETWRAFDYVAAEAKNIANFQRHRLDPIEEYTFEHLHLVETWISHLKKHIFLPFLYLRDSTTFLHAFAAFSIDEYYALLCMRVKQRQDAGITPSRIAAPDAAAQLRSLSERVEAAKDEAALTKIRKAFWKAEKRLLGGRTDHFLLPPGSLLRDIEDLRNIISSYSWLECFKVILGMVYFVLLVYLVQHPSLEAVHWDATLLLFTFTIGILVVASVWNLVHYWMISVAVTELHIFAFKVDLLQKIDTVHNDFAADQAISARVAALNPPHDLVQKIRRRFWRLQFYFSEPSLLHDYVRQLSLHPKPRTNSESGERSEALTTRNATDVGGNPWKDRRKPKNKEGTVKKARPTRSEKGSDKEKEKEREIEKKKAASD